MQNNYEAKDIKVLEGLDAVRLRPGMYVGTTGLKGLHHILWEIVDNAIDEVANGFGNKIIVTLNPDGSASVEDNGRGIPVDLHPQLGISGVEVVFTQLHAGGKFDTTNYSFSGGLHGVGASVTNALSEWLKVYVYRDGWEYRMEFASYEDEQGKIRSGVAQGGLMKVQPTQKTGTLVVFYPDKRVFDSIIFSSDIIAKRLKELAFLNKGITIVFKDLRNEHYPLVKEFCYKGGLIDFVKYVNEAKNTLHDPLYFEGEKDDIYLSIAIQYNDSYTDTIISYVNNIPTTEGGTHETGIKAAITRVFNDLARKYGLLKEKDPNLLGEDFREGLTVVMSVKMHNVQFEGQTKTKLGNPDARIACESILASEIYKFFEKNSKKRIAEKIIQKAIGAARVREASRKAKEITRQKNSLENANLVGKLSSCTSKKPEINELFIVEGDSAGGTAKQARDRYFQAILPLRGKPLNAEKKRLDQVLQNEEIRTIISALGAGIGEDFLVDNLNYHKVIILSDADQDGAHIRAILLTFFFRYMKDLINEGFVYIGMPPLYKVYKKDIVEYAYTDEELDIVKEKVGRGYQIQRYKGLGEMNADQLWETTMNPKTRKLIQVTIDDAAEAEKLVTTLMGDAVELRKSYIIEYANFNKDDRLLGEMG
ncbi:MAG: type IIA DNA topoisomerase subunit B [Clostridiales bacterium]|nr:type IIA DNA topoisomerase subunit B [Clostridiales bacterium]